jgi:transcriptional regulator with XRE-family HTH domain
VKPQPQSPPVSASAVRNLAGGPLESARTAPEGGSASASVALRTNLGPYSTRVKCPQAPPSPPVKLTPKMIDWNACAAVFRARIGDRKLTAVARRAGINRSHLSQILKGTRHPSLDVFAALCRELRVTPSEVSRILDLTPLPIAVGEGSADYLTEPPATVEVSQDGATLTLVVHLKPKRTPPSTRPEEEP